MKFAEVLYSEHRRIEAMLDIMEATARRLGQGHDVPTRVLADIMDFSEHFTSNCHHAKEEHLLFPLLAQHGLGPDSSPIAALSAQHETAHAYLREMRAALDRMRDNDPNARQVFAASARDYVGLIREHIRIEDHYFGEVARGEMTDVEDELLADRMSAIDRTCARPGDLERFQQMIADYREMTAGW